MHVTFLFAFSSRYAKTQTSNFHKVVRKLTEGMVGSIIWILLVIYCSFQQWKNVENALKIDKVIAMSLVYYFFLGHSVYFMYFVLLYATMISAVTTKYDNVKCVTLRCRNTYRTSNVKDNV